jgi:hypothetical protein
MCDMPNRARREAEPVAAEAAERVDHDAQSCSTVFNLESGALGADTRGRQNSQLARGRLAMRRARGTRVLEKSTHSSGGRVNHNPKRAEP